MSPKSSKDFRSLFQASIAVTFGFFPVMILAFLLSLLLLLLLLSCYCCCCYYYCHLSKVEIWEASATLAFIPVMILTRFTVWLEWYLILDRGDTYNSCHSDDRDGDGVLMELRILSIALLHFWTDGFPFSVMAEKGWFAWLGCCPPMEVQHCHYHVHIVMSI